MNSSIDEASVLVTGGSGTLGSSIRLVLPNALFPTRQELDLCSDESVKEFLNRYKVSKIIHCAALTGIRQCDLNKRMAYSTNVTGTRRLLANAFYKKVDHFIYVSTACVFSGEDENIMEDEESVPDPKNYYGLTKVIAEEITKSYSSTQMRTTIVRTNFSSMPWPYPKAFVDRYGTYLLPNTIASALKQVILEKPMHQVIHICSSRKTSMYEYALVGGSKVDPISLAEYDGPKLTKNMCITSKYWRLYDL